MKVYVTSWEGLPEPWQKTFSWGKGEYHLYLVVENCGQVVRCERDAMEPEDANFGRDLAWVAGAIEDAYELGQKQPGIPLEKSI